MTNMLSILPCIHNDRQQIALLILRCHLHPFLIELHVASTYRERMSMYCHDKAMMSCIQNIDKAAHAINTETNRYESM